MSTSEIVRLWLPIGISVLALFVSGLNFGWSIYKEVILKARVKVHLAVVSAVTPGAPELNREQYIRIELTNHGPGKVRINMISGLVAPLWRRLLRQVGYFVVLHDHQNPMNPRLPLMLDVGESATLLMPYDDRSVLNTNATHIGAYDSFGRYHFAPKAELRTAREQFRKDFSKATPMDLTEKW